MGQTSHWSKSGWTKFTIYMYQLFFVKEIGDIFMYRQVLVRCKYWGFVLFFGGFFLLNISRTGHKNVLIPDHIKCHLLIKVVFGIFLSVSRNILHQKCYFFSNHEIFRCRFKDIEQNVLCSSQSVSACI